MSESSTEPETLSVDDLHFEVRRSPRRRALELTIDRGGELVLAAPEQLDARVMRQFIRERKLWIYTKLALKQGRQSASATRAFVDGASFRYLGRRHELRLSIDQACPLILERGRFRLLRSEADRARAHFVRWYRDHARVWLQRRLSDWAPRLGVMPAGMRVLDLGHRWGSCGHSGTLNFHWSTILLPPRIVEYVVVHELVHLREPNHTQRFWRSVQAALPDALRRKQWLAENGAAAVAW